MSVIKAKPNEVVKPAEVVKSEFHKTPLNQLLDELKQKLKEHPSRHISGSSEVHELPPCSGGQIIIPIECDFEYVPHITLQCADPLIFDEDKSHLKLSIENLLDLKRMVRINYFLN